MATTFTLKRKYFAEADQNKGMSTAGKVAAGVGTAALAFAGARRGVFGVNAAKATNKVWGQAGQMLQRSSMESISKLGAGMEKNALKTNGRVVYNDAVKTLQGSGTTREIKRMAGQEARNANATLFAPKS